jgi:hypothetical protein
MYFWQVIWPTVLPTLRWRRLTDKSMTGLASIIIAITTLASSNR